MFQLTLEALIKIALLIWGLLTAAAYLVLLERRVAAWVQDRRGPNRVGIPLTNIRVAGLGQPLADGLKFVFKEEFIPSHVDRFLYVFAPITILVAAIAVFAVIPFGSIVPPLGTAEPIPLVIAPALDVGMIYVFALSSLAVYGVILGGWASNNKYSFLGGLRSSAQLISYELPLSLGILGVVLAAGTLRLDVIIDKQADSNLWFAVTQPLGLLVFVIAAFAEAARLPFDLPECEQELIGGYHTEYAGIKLLMFLMAEFLHMVTAAFLIVILFFGGWHLWGITQSQFWGLDLPEGAINWPLALLRVGVLFAKVMIVILFFMLVRWSWPRFRFDQLMALAWKVMLPLGIVNLIMIAVLTEYGQTWNESIGRGTLIASTWALSIAACVLAALLGPMQSDNRPRAGKQQL